MNLLAPMMPLYRCHKLVRAAEIAEVVYDPQGALIRFLDEGIPPISVSLKLFTRYKPTTGDWYVVYDDGYESISPRKPFVEGYHPFKHKRSIWPYGEDREATLSPVSWAMCGAGGLLIAQAIVILIVLGIIAKNA